MAKVNRKWHDKNRLGKRAATKERVKWHLAHAKSCGCRPIPAKIQRVIDKKSEAKPSKSKKPVSKSTKAIKKK